MINELKEHVSHFSLQLKDAELSVHDEVTVGGRVKSISDISSLFEVDVVHVVIDDSLSEMNVYIPKDFLKEINKEDLFLFNGYLFNPKEKQDLLFIYCFDVEKLEQDVLEEMYSK